MSSNSKEFEKQFERDVEVVAHEFIRIGRSHSAKIVTSAYNRLSMGQSRSSLTKAEWHRLLRAIAELAADNS